MRVAFRKLDGVESVEVSLQRASAEIRLRRDNRVTLTALRQIVKDNGFTAKDAGVTVVGALIERGGKPALTVSGLNVVWLLVADPKQAGPYNEAARRVAAAEKGVMEITGIVAPPASPGQPEQMTVVSIKP